MGTKTTTWGRIVPKVVSMNIDLITSFVPEFREKFIRRYEILEFLDKEGTIGRRTLSGKMEISERIIREEVSILREMECVNVSAAGISITKKGKITLKNLLEIYSELNNLIDLGNAIATILHVKKVIVVKGNTTRIEHTYTALGQKAASVIEDSVCNGDVLGITGGRTLAAIADEMETSRRNIDVTIIPARGSLGKNVKFQANRVASKIAMKLGCEYRLLPVPDTASPEAMKMLMENEEVKEAYNLLSNLDILVFGIGRADVMLKRRNVDDRVKDIIIKDEAVSEAFGHYFDINGSEVFRSQSIGISIKNFMQIPRIIGVAGGARKAEAIISIAHLRNDMILIIDESAAKEIKSLMV